jgi:predicted RNase H-like HicB family nuclease
MELQYSILIQWSDEDKKYIVSLPEFGPYAHTHGETYDDALKNGQEVLELLIEDYQARGRDLPKPMLSYSAS